jgi:hypothetical protein
MEAKKTKRSKKRVVFAFFTPFCLFCSPYNLRSYDNVHISLV